MKQGEKEAKLILSRLGFSFDPSYYDDNSKQSMPDLKTLDGRYIEVTHTKHNNNVTKCNKFSMLSAEEQLSKIEEAQSAYNRICHKDYETDDTGSLTQSAISQHEKDVKLKESHYGFINNEKSTEFKCDLPVIEYSVDNILREIVDDKGSKYKNGKTDLFVFVTEDEYRIFKQLLSEKEWNCTFSEFEKSINKAPFKTIFICCWKFETQQYITDNSALTRIKKLDNGVVEFDCMPY